METLLTDDALDIGIAFDEVRSPDIEGQTLLAKRAHGWQFASVRNAPPISTGSPDGIGRFASGPTPTRGLKRTSTPGTTPSTCWSAWRFPEFLATAFSRTLAARGANLALHVLATPGVFPQRPSRVVHITD